MDKEDQEHFRKLAVALPKRGGGLSKPHDAASSNLSRDPDYTLTKATAICACYRKNEAGDPDIYVAALAALLSQYPISVVDYVADPRTGIVTTCKWLPSLAEVREFCDQRAKLLGESIERDRRRDEQIAATEQYRKEQASRSTRLTYDELKAKYGDSKGGWGINNAEGEKEREERKQRILGEIQKANKQVFERECKRDGVDAAGGVSAALLKRLKETSQ